MCPTLCIRRRGCRPLRAAFAGLAVLSALAALGLAAPAALAESGAYVQRNLVSDGSIPAEHADPNLINAWGIALGSTGMAWVTANGSSASTVYDGQGNALPFSAQGVDIPGGRPTGVVTNEGDGFPLPGADGTPESSALIFATEAGIISGWNPNADPSRAIARVDNADAGAVYKGLALAANGLGRFLYATDFHGAKVDVFDSDFQPVPLPPGAFADPALPPGFAPFGIQNIQGSLYVTYAKREAEGDDSVAGPGLGILNVFDPDGRLLRRLISRGRLNAPWGLALAPADFGPFSHHLLVANFGDGRINAYNLATGEFRGQVGTGDKKPLVIDGLWGIRFGNGVQDQPTNALFFAAGPHAANQGLYGRIEPADPLKTASTRLVPTPPPSALKSGDPAEGVASSRPAAQAAQGSEEAQPPAGAADKRAADVKPDREAMPVVLRPEPASEAENPAIPKAKDILLESE